jgi:hypothetical protein
MDEGDKVTLKRITAEERERWDSIVAASPYGTVFHTWPWVTAMAKHGWMKLMGGKVTPVLHPLIAEHKGKDIGLIPLYELRGRLLTYVLSPPPHTDVNYLGPCLNNPKDMKQSAYEKQQKIFHNALDEYLGNLGAQCSWIRTAPGDDDMRPYLWRGYTTTPLFNYSLDLRQPLDAIFEKSDYAFRRRVHKGERDGFVTVEGTFADVEALYRIQECRYLEKGLCMNLTLDYLKDLWDGLHPGKMQVFRAELDGEVYNATITTTYKGKMIAWFGNSKNPSKTENMNDFLNWNTIKWAVSHGCTEYENSWAIEERLNDFKTKINPSLNKFYSAVRMNRPLSLLHGVKTAVFGGKIWGAGL